MADKVPKNILMEVKEVKFFFNITGRDTLRHVDSVYCAGMIYWFASGCKNSESLQQSVNEVRHVELHQYQEYYSFYVRGIS